MSEELKNRVLENMEKLSHMDNDRTRFRLDCLEELFQDYSLNDTVSCPSINDQQVLLLLTLLYDDDFKDVPYRDDFDVKHFGISFLQHSDKYVTRSFNVLHYMHDRKLIMPFLEAGGYVPSELDINLDFSKSLKFLLKNFDNPRIALDFYHVVKENADDFFSACFLFKDLSDWSYLDPYFLCVALYKELDQVDRITFDEAVEITKKFHQIFEKLYESYLEQERTWKKNNKESKKQIGRYRDFLTKADLAFKKEEIENFEELVSLLPDDNVELRKEFLLEVFNHNQKEYKKIEEEYRRLSEHDLSRYITLFHSYSLSFSEIPQDIQKRIQDMSYGECSKRLDLIAKMKLVDIKVISSYLLYCDCHKLEEFNHLLEENILTSDLLTRFYSKLVQSEEYEKLKINIQTTLNYNIQMDKFHRQFDLLFMDTNLFAENFRVLVEYECKITSRKVIDFSMLSDQNLVEKIDSFMEVGLEHLVIHYPEVLNGDMHLVDRIWICKKLNLPVFDQKNGLLRRDVFDKNLFFVSDKNIHQYAKFIPVDLNDIDENKLSFYSKNLYQYEGQLISRKRWERYQKQKLKAL